MDMLKDLHELCHTIGDEISNVNKKLRNAEGKISGTDVEYIDRLTHTLKSIKTTIAMIEADGEENGYSGDYMPRMGTYYDDRTGRSYAGRRNARRDSMGRYSRDGEYSRNGNNYSYAESMDAMLDDMRGMMGSMPEEKRREVERFLDKMERM